MRWLAALPLAHAACVHAQGEVVELDVTPAVTASAWYSVGTHGPAVLLLHGFLQTRDYLTVSSLRDSLAEEGYTVLAPTLSLGIDHRRASLACEAAHTHTQAGDLDEIAQWVDWLKAQGQRDIVLVGHSHGALLAVAYEAGRPDPAVRRVIGVSLIGVEDSVDQGVHRARVAAAVKRLAAGDHELASHRLSFCRRFVATPESFVSYGRWDSARVLDAVGAATVPVDVVLGRADARLPGHWAQALRARGAMVAVVPGAGHFFDDRYEFDLLDEVAQGLQGSASGAP